MPNAGIRIISYQLLVKIILMKNKKQNLKKVKEKPNLGK